MNSPNKELPITIPIIKTHQYLAYPLSIILNYEETKPWFYSNYVQLVCRDLNLEFEYAKDFSNNPWLTITTCDTNITKDEFLKFLISAIKKEEYIYLFVDKYYISNFSQFLKFHFSHDLLIYGFDLENQFLHGIGYDKTGKFVFLQLRFQELIEGWMSEHNDQRSLTLMKYNSYRFHNYAIHSSEQDLIRLYDLTYKYLHGIPAYVDERSNSYFSQFSGMDIYKPLINVLNYYQSIQKPLDIRIFHALWEHKLLMVERIHFLSQHFGENNTEKLIAKATILEKKALIIRNLVLKYNLLLLEQIPHNLVVYLSELEKLDQAFTIEFLEVLKKSIRLTYEQRRYQQNCLLILEVLNTVKAEPNRFYSEYISLITTLILIEDIHFVYHAICIIPEAGLHYLSVNYFKDMDELFSKYMTYIESRKWDDKIHVEWMTNKCSFIFNLLKKNSCINTGQFNYSKHKNSVYVQIS